MLGAMMRQVKNLDCILQAYSPYWLFPLRDEGSVAFVSVGQPGTE